VGAWVRHPAQGEDSLVSLPRPFVDSVASILEAWEGAEGDGVEPHLIDPVEPRHVGGADVGELHVQQCDASAAVYGLDQLLQIFEREGVGDELGVGLDDGSVGGDGLDDGDAKPLDPLRQAVAFYQLHGDHIATPHGVCGGVEAYAEEALLLPAQLIVSLNKPSAKHENLPVTTLLPKLKT